MSAPTAIDLQINPAATPWHDYRVCSLRAEELGFGALWVYDHLAGATLRGTTMLEAIALLGGLATMTSRIHIGAMVLNAGLRQPGVLGASLASLQTMADGRLMVGIGAGAAPTSRWAAELDAAAIDVGATLAERHQRVIHTIEVFNQMWSGGLGPLGFPAAEPRPPIIVGVNSDALTMLAADNADGINVLLSHPRHGELIDLARTRTNGEALITITIWAVPDDPTEVLVALATARTFDPDRIIIAVSGRATQATVERIADVALS